jgi:hypothetical protein
MLAVPSAHGRNTVADRLDDCTTLVSTLSIARGCRPITEANGRSSYASIAGKDVGGCVP